MKKVFLYLILLACTQAVFGQQRISKSELETLTKQLKQHPLLLDDDMDFKSNSSTDKWQNESAVILCQKTSFNFDKKGMSAGKRIGRNVWGLVLALPTLGTSLIMANTSNETKMLIEETERRRLLLKDKFALEQYSVLYFRLDAEGDAFAARVIKKDGSVQPVDLDEAIKVSDIRTIPDLFRSYTDNRFGSAYRPDYYKIAVPDLVEGDVIEYQFRNFNTREYTYNPNYKEFDPIYYLCNRDMPVAKQVIEVVTEDDKYYIGYKSMKGAPEFVETNANGKKVYRWEDAGRDKMTDTRFVNEFMQMPSVKFQVTYARNNSRDFVWFKNSSELKNDVSETDLADKARNFWFHPEKLENTGSYTAGLRTDIASTEKALFTSLKKKSVTGGSDDEYIKKSYYLIRSQTLFNNWSDFAFAKIFSGLLQRQKIDHEIVVTTSNIRTNLNKVAFTQELVWVVKCKNKFYCNPGEHLNPEDIPVELAGNAAIRFHYANDKLPVASEVLPLSDTTSNVLKTQLKTTFDLTNLTLSIEKNVEARGLTRDDLINEALALTPFMESDYRNYDGMSMWDGINSRQEEKATEDFNELKRKWKEEKPDMMKAMAEDEYGFNVQKYNNFKIVQDGREYKKRNLRYSENFVLADMTSKAGEDILISLPALIGQQTKIKNDEKARTMPVDVRYPRAMDWYVVFPIPAGYTVKGIEELSKNVSNECGSFSSSVRVDNNNLIMQVSKMYKSKYFDLNQWSNLLEVLEAAYSFSQSKIVLKKQ